MQKILVFILIGVFILVTSGCGAENKASNIVEDYMNAVKQGNDIDSYLETGVDGFIDVFEYESLKTLEAPKEKDTISFEYDFWKEFKSDNTDTFADYKRETKEIFPEYEIIEESTEYLEIWDGKSYKDINMFLYNVTLANAKGEKLYKKVEFTVEYSEFVWDGEDFIEGYHITDIYIR
jgi:hypothetical protein